MDTHKFWLRSKTVLFNLLLALAGSWTVVEASLGNLRTTISPAHFGIVMAVVGLVGVLLRFYTAQAITASKATKKGS